MVQRARTREFEPVGRPTRSPNKRTAAKPVASQKIAEVKEQAVPAAKKILSDLMMTAMGLAAQHQKKLIAWEANPENEGKEPPAELVDCFLKAMNAAGRAAAALAPYQEGRFSTIKMSSPPDAPAVLKADGKSKLKINLKDPVECERIYRAMIRTVE
jgi:hypothetical protein